MSVIEIMVVVALGSMVLLGGSVLMSRTHRSYKKGTDMINTQALLDSIVERLRTDVRSLVMMETAKSQSVVFIANLRGQPRRIRYEYDGKTQTLTRREEAYAVPGTAAPVADPGEPPPQDSTTNFRGAGQVAALAFKSVPGKTGGDDFHHLDLAMQLISDERGRGPGSRLSILCHFYSRCLEAPNPYRR